jgi:hypothetical protein
MSIRSSSGPEMRFWSRHDAGRGGGRLSANGLSLIVLLRLLNLCTFDAVHKAWDHPISKHGNTLGEPTARDDY